MGRINTTTGESAGLKSVSSTSGFSAGDLIYQTTSDTGLIPTDYVASIGYPAKGTLAGGTTFNNSASYNKIITQGVPKQYGYQNGEPAAVLSNGNIVEVFVGHSGSNSNSTTTQMNRMLIKISEPDGTLVSDTILSLDSLGSTYVLTGSNSYARCVSVAASSLGGFCIAFTGSTSSYGNYAVYDNAGTQINIGSLTNTNTLPVRIKVVALSTGNYAIGATNQNADNLLRVNWVNATTGAIGASSLGMGSMQAGLKWQWDMAASSDGRLMTSYIDTSNRPNYSVTSDYLTSSSSLIDSATDVYATAITTNSNGRFVVLLQRNAVPYIAGLKIEDPSSDGSFGSILGETFENDNLNKFNDNRNNYVIDHIGNDKYFFSTTGTYNNTAGIYNSLGQLQTTYYNLGCHNSQGARKTLVVGDHIRHYSAPWTDEGNTQNRSAYSTVYGNFGYNKINATTFSVEGGNLSPIQTLATVTQPLGAYSKSNSTPSSAVFTIGTNYSETVTNLGIRNTDAPSFDPVTRVVADMSSTYQMRGIQLANGNVMVVRLQGNNLIYRHIFDSNYTELSVEQFSHNATNGYAMDMTKLRNGNIIIVYVTGTDDFTCRIYDQNGTEVKGETVLPMTGMYSSIANSPRLIRVTALYEPSLAMFAVGAPMGNSYAQVAFYNEDCTFRNFLQLTNQTSLYDFNMQADLSGERIWGCYSAASTNAYHKFYIEDTNSDGIFDSASQFGYFSSSTSSYRRTNFRPFLDGSGRVVVAGANGAGNTNITRIGGQSASNQGSTIFEDQYTNQHGSLVTCTGQGDVVAFHNSNNYSQPRSIYSTRSQDNAFFKEVNSLTINVQGNTDTAGCAFPAFGNEAHFVYKSGNTNQLGFMRVRISNSITNINFVAGTDTSNPIVLDANKASFVGVAITDCAANDTGIIQVKGAAVLGTDYSTETPASKFDFRRATTKGVSGSISGRNVTLGE
jgi:hypothetical protein